MMIYASAMRIAMVHFRTPRKLTIRRFTTTQCLCAARPCAPGRRRRSAASPRQQISARYRGHGTDLAKVPEFQRHDSDTGSPEAQVARLPARVEQLTAHLKQHKTDYSTTRGLMAILSKRKQLLKYLRSNDKEAYERCLAGSASVRSSSASGVMYIFLGS